LKARLKVKSSGRFSNYTRRPPPEGNLTNAIVSKPPVPIKKPRRESIKNPPRCDVHLEDWRPTVAHAGHIVVPPFAGLGLVGGTVRSSQDASAVFIYDVRSFQERTFVRA